MANPAETLDAKTPPLYIAYQPVLRMQQSILEVYALESLLRVGPNAGDHTTHSVITAAEQNGTMPALDTMIARQVCSDANQLADMRLWINLSQRTLSAPPVARHIAGIIAEHDLACRITIEMTETADGSEQLILDSLRWFESRQIAVVIDDIDDGYAKSHLLRSAKISGCKLSRRSTVRMSHDPKYLETITKLVRWCKSNGKTVVIEGIENEQELSVAVDLGADFFQGFYFWAPVPLAEIPAPGTLFPYSSRAPCKSEQRIKAPEYVGALAVEPAHF